MSTQLAVDSSNIKHISSTDDKESLVRHHLLTGDPLDVIHSQYGKGTVLTIDRSNRDCSLTILFDDPINESGVRRISKILLHANSLHLVKDENADSNDDLCSNEGVESAKLPAAKVSPGDFIVATVRDRLLMLEVLGTEDSPTGKVLVATGHSRIGVCRIPFDGRKIEVLGNSRALEDRLRTKTPARDFCSGVCNSVFSLALQEASSRTAVVEYLEKQLQTRGYYVTLDKSGNISGTDETIPVIPAVHDLRHGIPEVELDRIREEYAEWSKKRTITSREAPTTVVKSTEEPIKPVPVPSDLLEQEEIRLGEQRLAELQNAIENKFGVLKELDLKIGESSQTLMKKIAAMHVTEVEFQQLQTEVTRLRRLSAETSEELSALQERIKTEEESQRLKEEALEVREAGQSLKAQELLQDSARLRAREESIESRELSLKSLEASLEQLRREMAAPKTSEPAVIAERPVHEGLSKPETEASLGINRDETGRRPVEERITERVPPPRDVGNADKYGLHGLKITSLFAGAGWVIDPAQARLVSGVIVQRGLDADKIARELLAACRKNWTVEQFLRNL